MCLRSWGRNEYARALVEVSSEKDLMESIAAVLVPEDKDGFVDVRRKKNKSKQPRQIDGVRMTKPIPKLHYRRVEKGESSYSQVKGDANIIKEKTSATDVTKQDGPNVDKYTKASIPKGSIVSLKNSFSALEEEAEVDEVWGPKDKWQQIVSTINESDSEDVDEELVLEDRKGKNVTDTNTEGASTPVEKLSVCAIPESHVCDAKLEKLCSYVFRNWEWTSNGACCSKCSRIILGWNRNEVDLSMISFDDQVIHSRLWMKADKKELFVSFIYAHNRYTHRRTLWSNLKVHKHYVRHRPWCILGDFNATLFLDDMAAGSSTIDIYMREFKECVHDIEVLDVQKGGLKFTWNQKPKGNDGVLKKIDRVMANLEFNDLYPGAHALFQPYRISDHSPAVLKLPTPAMVKLKPFKFTNILVHNDRFKQVVLEGWNTSVSVQCDLDSDPFNSKLRDEETVYVQAFNEALLMEERFLRQKAKIDWLREVADAFVSHYEVFLGQAGIVSNMDTNSLFHSKLDEETAHDMVRMVNDQEVKEAMFSMDITQAIQDFFINGKLLKEINHTIIALISKVASPNRVNDFTPISCCNVLFKCVSKIIANRIKESLKVFVSPNQPAFVPDDLFLFAYGDASSARVIVEALDEFKNASGLTPSLPKSMAYFCNVLNHVKLSIHQILHFEEGSLPVKYLGVPLVSSKLIYKDSKELIEKV
ncbi:hypothetical protein Tco_0140804 [Tanacetum coccineum]